VTPYATVENSPEESYRIDQVTGVTLLHRLILGIINGGYTETVTYTETGDWLQASCAITYHGQDVGYGRNPDATGTATRTEDHLFPPWPGAAEDQALS
jgi:hypothetical protein